MYSTSSGQRRGLLRPHSSAHSGPVFRNFPLFGFLAGLVIFFYIFYIYQAQNAELSLAHEQYEVESAEAKKLRNEIADLKAQLEKQKLDSETSLKAADEEKLSMTEKFQTCSSELDKQKLEVSRLEAEKNECSGKLQTLRKQLEQLNDTFSALQTVNRNNEEMVISLNQSIKLLREQLQKTQSETGNAAPNVNLSVGNQDVIQQEVVKPKTQAPQFVNGLPPQGEGQNEVLRDINPRFAAAQKSVFEERLANKVTTAVTSQQKPADENVIALPVPDNDQGKLQVKKFDAGGENKLIGGGGEKNDNEEVEDGKAVVLGKDYRNSAEEVGLQDQENKLKPDEDAIMDFENDDKRN